MVCTLRSHLIIERNTDLVHIVRPNDPIECAVQVVEKVHHLHRAALGAQRSETDNVAKVDCHTFELFRLHDFAGQQLRCDRSARIRRFVRIESFACDELMLGCLTLATPGTAALRCDASPCSTVRFSLPPDFPNCWHTAPCGATGRPSGSRRTLS